MVDSVPATIVRRVKEVCCEVMAELSGVREGYSEVSQLGCEKLLSGIEGCLVLERERRLSQQASQRFSAKFHFALLLSSFFQ